MNGEVLKRLRTIYGYNAKEFSQMIEISPSYLSEIESEKKQPSLEVLEKYAKLMKIKLSSLILLSESFEEAGKPERESILIRNLMVLLINKVSVGMNDENEK